MRERESRKDDSQGLIESTLLQNGGQSLENATLAGRISKAIECRQSCVVYTSSIRRRLADMPRSHGSRPHNQCSQPTTWKATKLQRMWSKTVLNNAHISLRGLYGLHVPFCKTIAWRLHSTTIL